MNFGGTQTDHSSSSHPHDSHPSPGTSGQPRLMSANIPLAKASHMTKLTVKGWGDTFQRVWRQGEMKNWGQ